MEKDVRKSLEGLNQQMRELTAIYHRMAGKYGISDGEFWVWYTLLLFDGELSQQDICEMWFLPRQTVNSAVSGMVRRGDVRLEAMPGTRNKKIIHLTPKGKQYGEGIFRGIYKAEQRAVEKMTPRERQDCADALSKYVHSLKEELAEKD